MIATLAPIRPQLASLLALLLMAGAAHAQSRGELLYQTHCIECHTTQMHWRDKKQANDWVSLKAQVSRWQATALLGWSDADIVEVANHLNERFYRFDKPTDRVSAAVTPGR